LRAHAEGGNSPPLRSSASHALADEKERIVRRLLDALEARDVVAIGELLADDVVYHFPGRGPVAGTYRGRDEVIGLFGAFAGLFDGPLSMASHDVVASEAHVVDLATYTASRAGQPFTWNAIRLYHVDGARIAEIWLMIGDVYALDAFLE
jgi:ketosteroid isomerase-like protein